MAGLESVILLATTAALSILALIVCFFIGVEVVGIIHEVAAQLAERSRYSVDRTIKRAPRDTAPLSWPPPANPVMPYQDRDTIKRLIDHFEGEVDPSVE